MIGNDVDSSLTSPSRLTAATLRGVWPALLTPWTDDDRIDETALVTEIHAFAAAKVAGIYTGGTAGEFYAQDDSTFSQLAHIVCRTARAVGLAVQIGCTALSTRTVCARIAIAREYRADAVQVALPFWLTLGDDEVLQFFSAIANAAGETPIVFYQTPRAKRRVDPPLLGQVARATPTLIGIKDTTADEAMFQAMHRDAPDVSIFGADCRLIERMSLGGTGTYSSLAGLHADYMLRYCDLCEQRRFEEALPLERLCQRLMSEVLIPMVRDEHLYDSAVDRVQRVAGGGACGLRCAGPYRSPTVEHVARVTQWCRMHAPELLPSH